MVRIRFFENPDADAFRDLNLAWIRKYFTVEEKDQKSLGDPHTYFLNTRTTNNIAGQIIIAEKDGVVIGTTGLAAMGEKLELAKMAVAEDCQRQGIADLLMRAAIDYAKQHKTNMWLETNSKLQVAIKLYEKHGFVHLTKEECINSPYARCNVQMKYEVAK